MGYGSFPLGMIEYLWRAKQPYNVSVAAEVAACAALTNMDYLDKVCACVCVCVCVRARVCVRAHTHS